MEQEITEQTAEDLRIKALKRYEILDTPPDGSFDKLTKLAAQLLDVPVVIISLADTDRIWFKSKFGIDTEQIRGDSGFCSSAILSDDIYLAEDARDDLRSLANPLVTCLGFQFYAGAPLKTHDGHNLGTFCILDKRPRQLTEPQKEILKDFAEIVMEQMELRLEAKTAVSRQNQLLSVAAHDLKNPITNISLRAEIMKRRKNDPDAIENLSAQIKESSIQMSKIIENLLKAAKAGTGKIHLNVTLVNLADLIEKAVLRSTEAALSKQQIIELDIIANPLVFADETKLAEAADHLISNAVKYSENGKTIQVKLCIRESRARVEVIDEGLGLTPIDILKMFRPFTRLSAQPTNGETAAGLGLSVVKAIMDAHKGEVWAESEGKETGSKFIMELHCHQQ